MVKLSSNELLARIVSLILNLDLVYDFKLLIIECVIPIKSGFHFINIEYVDYYISNGMQNYDFGLFKATTNGNIPIMHYFISLGANDALMALIGATMHNQTSIIENFHTIMPDYEITIEDYLSCLDVAKDKKNVLLTTYFEQKIELMKVQIRLKKNYNPDAEHNDVYMVNGILYYVILHDFNQSLSDNLYKRCKYYDKVDYSFIENEIKKINDYTGENYIEFICSIGHFSDDIKVDIPAYDMLRDGKLGIYVTEDAAMYALENDLTDYLLGTEDDANFAKPTGLYDMLW